MTGRTLPSLPEGFTQFRKSSFSPDKFAEYCVMAAASPEVVAACDSKLMDKSPIVTFGSQAWRDLIGTLRAA